MDHRIHRNASRLTAFIVVAALSMPAWGSDMSDYDAIKTTIFNYFDGIRHADRARLEKAFAVDAGHMKGYLQNAEGEWELSVRPMNEVIDDWSSRKPSPDMRGEIEAINIYSDVAATVLFDFNGVYTDAFHLAKIDGEWRIVNKFYIGR